MQHKPIARIVNLVRDEDQHILNLPLEEARQLLLADDPAAVLGIEGSFALVARDGVRVRLARSLDRPLRYFLAKQEAGPFLIVADRIDAIREALDAEGQRLPVPSHLHADGPGAPRDRASRWSAAPTRARRYAASSPAARTCCRPTADAIGEALRAGALRRGAAALARPLPARAPIGVSFSGGADSGAVLLCAYRALLDSGQSPARLKAFTLAVDGGGDDLAQARAFLARTGLDYLGETIEVGRRTRRSAARRSR